MHEKNAVPAAFKGVAVVAAAAVAFKARHDGIGVQGRQNSCAVLRENLDFVECRQTAGDVGDNQFINQVVGTIGSGCGVDRCQTVSKNQGENRTILVCPKLVCTNQNHKSHQENDAQPNERGAMKRQPEHDCYPILTARGRPAHCTVTNSS
jgi:hypothetical protein